MHAYAERQPNERTNEPKHVVPISSSERQLQIVHTRLQKHLLPTPSHACMHCCIDNQQTTKEKLFENSNLLLSRKSASCSFHCMIEGKKDQSALGKSVSTSRYCVFDVNFFFGLNSPNAMHLFVYSCSCSSSPFRSVQNKSYTHPKRINEQLKRKRKQHLRESSPTQIAAATECVGIFKCIRREAGRQLRRLLPIVPLFSRLVLSSAPESVWGRNPRWCIGRSETCLKAI
jgi:hypothetical protein